MLHSHRYLTPQGLVIPAITVKTAITGNGIIGYVIPADCVGMMRLGFDLQCQTQQAKLAEAMRLAQAGAPKKPETSV
jgi:hypothetical protein